MVCVDVHDIPVVAVVDPDMMSTMPKGLTAATGDKYRIEEISALYEALI